MLRSFIQYWWRRRTEHALHSPFVFALYTQVIRPKSYRSPAVFDQIEQLRQALLHDRSEIEVLDLGAGSRTSRSAKRRISSVARSAEKPAAFAQLLYRLVAHFKPTTVFDLGTSLGLTTLYLAKANPAAQVLTFEGCPQTATWAQRHLEQYQCTNVQLILGNLDETLSSQIGLIQALDFAFFDANHRYQPTLNYFEACLSKAHEDTVFVFDDIHWSPEMERAWRDIQAHPKVTITIDLFFVGLVFFRAKQPKQHFVLRY